MLLQFRMLSDEEDNFLRDYLLPPSMTLADLHAFISDDLKYERKRIWHRFSSLIKSGTGWLNTLTWIWVWRIMIPTLQNQ